MTDLAWLILTIAATIAGLAIGYRVARAGRRHEQAMLQFLDPPEVPPGRAVIRQDGRDTEGQVYNLPDPPAPLWHGATKDQP